MRRLAALLALSMTFGCVYAVTVAAAKAPGPNGRILYTYDTNDCDDCHLTTIDPDGSDAIEIPDAFAGRWSPDGTRIATGAMAPDGRLSTLVMEADGTDRTTFDLPDPTLNLVCTIWFPDATRLLCESWDEIRRHRPGGLWSVDATDGSDLVRLTTNRFEGNDIPADVSPDGEHLLFLRENRDRRHRQIGLFVADADGSNVTRIVGWLNGSACCQASWSPDGSTIVFAHKGRLRTVAPSGEGSQAVALDAGGPAYAFQPGWSPDGTRIVFAMYLEATSHVDIFTAADDGSDLTQLTDTPEEDGFPDWGPSPTIP